MPDFHSSEEEAALYVLGELTDTERTEFEKRLAQSPELGALVRELQEAATALAMTAPHHRPPPGMWGRIETAVAKESRKLVIPRYWIGWWRNGWAAAAACLIGWMLYAFWINRSRSLDLSPVSKANSPPATLPADAPPTEPGGTTPQLSSISTNTRDQLLESRLRRIGVLRSQVWDLENQVTQLSQALAKNQALLAESSRLKFLQLASPSNISGVASTPRLSADLQRTLFFAMARELGWLTPAEIEALRDGPPGTAPNRIAVEFVDLRPGTNRLVNLPQLPKADAQVADAAASTPPPTSPATSGAAIPAFISGDNMVLAIDSSLAPTGSSVTFWAGTPGQQQPLGTTVIGENPAAVTIPFVSTSANGWNVTVIAATPGGGSNVIGQFSAHATTSP